MQDLLGLRADRERYYYGLELSELSVALCLGAARRLSNKWTIDAACILNVHEM